MRKGKIYELIERLNVATNRLDGAYYIAVEKYTEVISGDVPDFSGNGIKHLNIVKFLLDK